MGPCIPFQIFVRAEFALHTPAPAQAQEEGAGDTRFGLKILSVFSWGSTAATGQQPAQSPLKRQRAEAAGTVLEPPGELTQTQPWASWRSVNISWCPTLLSWGELARTGLRSGHQAISFPSRLGQLSTGEEWKRVRGRTGQQRARGVTQLPRAFRVTVTKFRSTCGNLTLPKTSSSAAPSPW